MARSRNIKPGFFKNEDLVELPFEYRLLFIGLWTMADREGRLEDRPKRIRIEAFPADNVDVDAGLQALADSGFIVRYCVDGMGYIAIPTWCSHQNPHQKEAASTIPAPPKPETSTGLAPDSPETNTSAAGLIPDSLLLIPDSPSSKDACASSDSGDPDRDWIWRDGIKLLAQTMPDRKARSCIGGWLKKHTAHQVRTAVVSAERAQTGDPVPYITRILGREARIVDELMAGLE